MAEEQHETAGQHPDGTPKDGSRESVVAILALADRAAKGALTDSDVIDRDPVAALFGAAGASTFIGGAQAHALLYVGDQVRALNATIREAVAAGADVAGKLLPAFVEALTPPTRIRMPGIDLARPDEGCDLEMVDFHPSLVQDRRANRGEGGTHPVDCRCDSLCRALGREVVDMEAKR